MKMSIVDPKLGRAIFDKLRTHLDWEEVSTMIRKNTSGSIYLVGGKIYRTAIELVHDYDAGSKDVDWDVLCVGEVVPKYRAHVEPSWEVYQSSYGNDKRHSLTLKRFKIGQGFLPGLFHREETGKIDIIGAKDLAPFEPSVRGYYEAVPLDIQAISLNLLTKRIEGSGLKSIERRIVSVNNSAPPKMIQKPLTSYLIDKAQEIKFSWTGTTLQKIPCNCWGNDIKALFNNGCINKECHI